MNQKANSLSHSPLGLVLPAALAFAMFFSWIMLVNSLRIPFYFLYERTIFLIYFSRILDPTVWILSSIFAMVLVAAAGTRSGSNWISLLFLLSGVIVGALTILGVVGQHVMVAGFLATFVGCALVGLGAIKDISSLGGRQFVIVFVLVLSLLILPAEVGSLLYYSLSAFQPGIQVGKSWELLELQLWYTAFPLIPVMYVIFLFSWAWAPFVTKTLLSLTRGESSSKPTEALSRPRHKVRLGHGKLAQGNASTRETTGWLWAIAGCLLLAVSLGYYPYFHDPAYPLVGTDIYWQYALPGEKVLSSSSWVAAAAGERHPLVVLAIAATSNLLGLGVESLLRYAYVILTLAFGMAVFLLVSAGSADLRLASLSALIVTFSTPTMAFMFTGTIAQWVALIFWILSIALLAVRKNSPRQYVLSTLGLSFGSVLVLFLHPWTWIAMIAGLIAYCVAAAILRLGGDLRDVGSILVVILVNGMALALSLGVISGAQGWRVAQAFSMIRNSLSSEHFGFGIWEIVDYSSQIWSQFLHPVLLILTLVGVIVLASKRDRFSAVVIAWVFAACITSVVAAPMDYDPLYLARGESQIFRAMLLTPFQVPAAVGLFFLRSRVDAALAGRSKTVRLVTGIAAGVVLLALLNGAFRALFPLLTDPHNHPLTP